MNSSEPLWPEFTFTAAGNYLVAAGMLLIVFFACLMAVEGVIAAFRRREPPGIVESGPRRLAVSLIWIAFQTPWFFVPYWAYDYWGEPMPANPAAAFIVGAALSTFATYVVVRLYDFARLLSRPLRRPREVPFA